MEQTKEHKERNKGGRPKKEATEKLKYRIAVKMTAADYFRLPYHALCGFEHK